MRSKTPFRYKKNRPSNDTGVIRKQVKKKTMNQQSIIHFPVQHSSPLSPQSPIAAQALAHIATRPSAGPPDASPSCSSSSRAAIMHTPSHARARPARQVASPGQLTRHRRHSADEKRGPGAVGGPVSPRSVHLSILM
jgi:hypothetical protein